MIRFVKHYFEGISDIEIYPMISLLLFFIVFVTMLIYVLRIPKKSIEEISNLPLDEEENINSYE
ncbi:MAG: cbb3-type cytochrome c oxidase subunit 3 [Flavobacteriaceae bacterium]|nr:cbb3-type cytochrome c oxidase subunit 3 [Flavobacteriaceae bacterium]